MQGAEEAIIYAVSIPMRNYPFPLIVCLVLAAFGATAHASPEIQRERVVASFLLARGRPPSAGEETNWAAQSPRSLSELLAQQQEELRSDGNERAATAARAWAHAFGQYPTKTEIEADAHRSEPFYFKRLQGNLDGLAQDAAKYQDVLARAYHTALGRAPYEIEREYWTRRAPLAFALVVECIDNWARRNAPGLMATGGRPMLAPRNHLSIAFRLSPTTASEVKTLAFPSSAEEMALASARSQNVLAPGGQGVASVGGIHLMVVGREQSPPDGRSTGRD